MVRREVTHNNAVHQMTLQQSKLKRKLFECYNLLEEATSLISTHLPMDMVPESLMSHDFAVRFNPDNEDDSDLT